MNLFQSIDFKSHAGLDLTWKIEMDALSDPDWFTLSQMIKENIPPFQAAIGIPRGGVKLGSLLNQYSTENHEDPYLLVDDVLTTGTSMIEYKKEFFSKKTVPILGVVVFARNSPPDWVTALFQMPI